MNYYLIVSLSLNGNGGNWNSEGSLGSKSDGASLRWNGGCCGGNRGGGGGSDWNSDGGMSLIWNGG